jgi:hypothetical protein
MRTQCPSRRRDERADSGVRSTAGHLEEEDEFVTAG